MLCEYPQGGYESVWKAKEVSPKKMARALRPEGQVGDAQGKEEGKRIPGQGYSSVQMSSGGNHIT